MTLTTLLIGVGIAALLLTGLVFALRSLKSWPVSYLQNFVGALFIFSGFVKAIDPLGTAYKMEQYFAEFETTFSNTSFAFIAPLFPLLSEYVTAFSVIMIVFEIMLGVMLLIGAARRFTSTALLVLLAFFTFLTGFTYLTGYVPADVNFFKFGQWGPSEPTNLKVTDCGCFGDFLKLEPRVSFLKDVFLLLPALVFVFATRTMHQLFTPRIRTIVTGVSVVALTLYCFSNYMWDLPHTDFRPFKNGVNIAERMAAEEEAELDIEVTAYRITDKATGKVTELPYDTYLERYKEFPKEEYELEQIKTEPAIPRTKISDFALSDAEGNEVTEELLAEPGYTLLLVAYKLYGEEHTLKKPVKDTLYVTDTIFTGPEPRLERRLAEVRDREEQITEYSWDPAYLKKWTETLQPVLQAAQAAGVKIAVATAYTEPERVAAFAKAIGANYPIYTGDDIMLKTIIRSNPGIVLLKQGTIVQKWHYKKLPSFADLQARYISQ